MEEIVELGVRMNESDASKAAKKLASEFSTKKDKSLAGKQLEEWEQWKKEHGFSN